MVRSYNGWLASRDPKAIGINPDWEPIKGHKFPGGIKSGDVEVVMTYVVQQLHKRVEPIDRDAIKDDWGWFFKPSANSPDLISCHSSGTAFDYNATRHPNGRRGTFSAKQVAEIRKIQAEVGGVVYWGGDRGHADEMHMEISGTPVEVAAVANRLRAPKPKPAPIPSEEDDMPTIIKASGKPTRLLAAPTCAVIDDATEKSWTGAGAKTVTYSATAYDALLKHVGEALGR